MDLGAFFSLSTVVIAGSTRVPAGGVIRGAYEMELLAKIVTRCHIMAKLEGVKLRRSYQREIKKLLRTIRFKSKGRKQGEAQRAVRRLRTIAGILIRDMRRKLSPEALRFTGSLLTSMTVFSAKSVPTRAKFTAFMSQTFPASAKARLTRNTSSAPRHP